MTEPSKMSHRYYFRIVRGTYPPLMTTSVSNRRSFFLSAASLAGAAAVSSTLIAQPTPTNLTAFLQTYDEAWASHNPQAIAMLHAKTYWSSIALAPCWKAGPSLRRLCNFSMGQEVHSIASLSPVRNYS